jgi:hypothetical protein
MGKDEKVSNPISKFMAEWSMSNWGGVGVVKECRD